jgi:8-oxo-dGTP diphosphatase
VGDGDGWVSCAQGHRHWGRFGAAGLLPWYRDAAGAVRVLLQHRAAWSHHGDTWGLLGGARDSAESSEVAALREAAEEGGVRGADLRVTGLLRDDHGGWSYDSMLTRTGGPVEGETNAETLALEWFTLDAVPRLPLHPGFARTWPVLAAAMRRLLVVVDAANVIGSRGNGWWRDRPGAARQLLSDLARTETRILPTGALPAGLGAPGLTGWRPEFVVVLEGQARAGAEGVPTRLEVALASGSGDDRVVEEVRRAHPDDLVLVVTADRGLRARVAEAGAATVGPSWLVRLMDTPEAGDQVPGRDSGT